MCREVSSAVKVARKILCVAVVGGLCVCGYAEAVSPNDKNLEIKNIAQGFICKITGVPQNVKEKKYGTFKVRKVVDGDTFVVYDKGRKAKVRILEVDTPESVSPYKNRNCKYGKIASNYTKKQLLGKNVKLTFDKEREDKYGRKLCYVYQKDGTFYNQKLVKKGYARAMIIKPNILHQKEILKAEKYAKKRHLGVWSKKAKGKTGW